MTKNFLCRLISTWILVSFLTTGVVPSGAYAQALNLPAPGTMVSLTPAFMPVLMKGVRVHPENPLLFDFILDSGKSSLKIESPEFKAESQKLIKYFLASLTIKEDDLWVNLSPYEKDRMITDELGKTELGRDMLAQDYILKQLTASLIYPEKDLGKAFWDRVYTKAREQFGSTDIPVDTFNKVWIIADKAKVLERNNVAYVVGAHLKVMLESDYVAAEKSQKQETLSPAQELAKQIIRDVVIPAIEKEVNEGRNFAMLRQMFYSMILASWYKLALKDALLNQVYSNQAKTSGVLSDDPAVKDKIYTQYLEAYKKGVFNYIKEDMDAVSRQPVPRKYFSGGLSINPRPDIQGNLLPGEKIQKDGAMALETVEMTGHDAAQGINPQIVQKVKNILNGFVETRVDKDILLQALKKEGVKARHVYNEVLEDKIGITPLIVSHAHVVYGFKDRKEYNAFIKDPDRMIFTVQLEGPQDAYFLAAIPRGRASDVASSALEALSREFDYRSKVRDDVRANKRNEATFQTQLFDAESEIERAVNELFQAVRTAWVLNGEVDQYLQRVVSFDPAKHVVKADKVVVRTQQGVVVNVADQQHDLTRSFKPYFWGKFIAEYPNLNHYQYARLLAAISGYSVEDKNIELIKTLAEELGNIIQGMWPWGDNDIRVVLKEGDKTLFNQGYYNAGNYSDDFLDQILKDIKAKEQKDGRYTYAVSLDDGLIQVHRSDAAQQMKNASSSQTPDASMAASDRAQGRGRIFPLFMTWNDFVVRYSEGNIKVQEGDDPGDQFIMTLQGGSKVSGTVKELDGSSFYYVDDAGKSTGVPCSNIESIVLLRPLTTLRADLLSEVAEVGNPNKKMRGVFSDHQIVLVGISDEKMDNFFDLVLKYQSEAERGDKITHVIITGDSSDPRVALGVQAGIDVQTVPEGTVPAAYESMVQEIMQKDSQAKIVIYDMFEKFFRIPGWRDSYNLYQTLSKKFKVFSLWANRLSERDDLSNWNDIATLVEFGVTGDAFRLGNSLISIREHFDGLLWRQPFPFGGLRVFGEHTHSLLAQLNEKRRKTLIWFGAIKERTEIAAAMLLTKKPQSGERPFISGLYIDPRVTLDQLNDFIDGLPDNDLWRSGLGLRLTNDSLGKTLDILPPEPGKVPEAPIIIQPLVLSQPERPAMAMVAYPQSVVSGRDTKIVLYTDTEMQQIELDYGLDTSINMSVTFSWQPVSGRHLFVPAASDKPGLFKYEYTVSIPHHVLEVPFMPFVGMPNGTKKLLEPLLGGYLKLNVVEEFKAGTGQDNAMPPGGIDLNAKKMGLDVAKDGKGVEMTFDPAMVAEFRQGNFTGVEGIILKIVPIESPLALLGL